VLWEDIYIYDLLCGMELGLSSCEYDLKQLENVQCFYSMEEKEKYNIKDEPHNNSSSKEADTLNFT
jgi:hypothetical protein